MYNGKRGGVVSSTSREMRDARCEIGDRREEIGDDGR